MFNLQTKESDFENIMPQRLVIGSHQGVGKTTAVSMLPNCLVLDLESGGVGYGGLHFNLKKEMERFNIENPISPLNLVGAFRMFIESLKQANVEKKDYVYDFLAIDTTTQFQVMASMRGTSMFRKSVIGQGMVKRGTDIQDVVAELPEGGGYLWLHKGWNDLYEELKGVVRHGVIFLAHTKQGSLLVKGENVTVRDLDLTGKLKLELLRDCQAASYLFRKDRNTVIMSFKSDERDLTTKTRCSHLANKEIEFSVFNEETKELTVNWHLIYPDWVKAPITKIIK